MSTQTAARVVSRPETGRYLHWGYKRNGVWFGLCGNQKRSDHPGYGTKGNGKPICPTCDYLYHVEATR